MTSKGKRPADGDEFCSTSQRRRLEERHKERTLLLASQEASSSTPYEPFAASLNGQNFARKYSVGRSSSLCSPGNQNLNIEDYVAESPKANTQGDVAIAEHKHTPAHLSNTKVTAVGSSPNLPYDVCFGLLLMEASCTHYEYNPSPDVAPVQITCVDNIIKLRYEGVAKEAGFLFSPVLSRLIREHSVTLSASLGLLKERPFKTSRSGGYHVRVRTLRVVVYGFLSSKDAVTTILDQDYLFLQRPEDSEYDRRVRYLNPMYFTRPGEDLPRMPHRSAAASPNRMSVSFDEEQLSEVKRGQVLRIFDEASGLDVDLDLHTKQSSRIISTLKEHQLQALAMMIERESKASSINPKYPSLWETSIEGDKRVYRHIVTKSVQCTPLPSLGGGILGDEMGLGKTLSTLALICHHLDIIPDDAAPQTTRVSRATLIVTPKSTMYGWKKQIDRHIRPGALSLLMYHGRGRQDSAAELHNNDIVLTTYDTLRSDWATYGPLYTCSWARVVLDEAHKIRNFSSKIFHATCEIRAHYRWCLTGTPIQNSLDDFGALLAFVGVPPFVTRDQFRFWISSPILSSREHSLHTLRKLVRATCLRRTKAHPYLAATLELPPKTESVEIVDLLPEEREMYEFFKRRSYLLASKDTDPDPSATSEATRKQQKSKSRAYTAQKQRRKSTVNIIVLISVLRLICDHGQALLPRLALEAWQNRDEGRVSWTLLQAASEQKRTCSICGCESFGEDDALQEAGMTQLPCKKHVACETCLNPTEGADLACPKCSTPGRAPSVSNLWHGDGAPVAPSSKVSALLRNIVATSSRDIKDGNHSPTKSVIFSYWTGMLDMISHALGPHVSSLNVSIVRIDGRSTLQQRRNALDQFNNDKSCTIMLATIGAMGEGVDLSVASDVHIVEPHWNPMAEAQAVDRVHRIGQIAKVQVTRYCVRDSIEEYVQWIQKDKLRIISKSLSSSEQSKVDNTEEEENLLEQRWEKLFKFFK